MEYPSYHFYEAIKRIEEGGMVERLCPELQFLRWEVLRLRTGYLLGDEVKRYGRTDKAKSLELARKEIEVRVAQYDRQTKLKAALYAFETGIKDFWKHAEFSHLVVTGAKYIIKEDASRQEFVIRNAVSVLMRSESIPGVEEGPIGFHSAQAALFDVCANSRNPLLLKLLIPCLEDEKNKGRLLGIFGYLELLVPYPTMYSSVSQLGEQCWFREITPFVFWVGSTGYPYDNKPNPRTSYYGVNWGALYIDAPVDFATGKITRALGKTDSELLQKFDALWHANQGIEPVQEYHMGVPLEHPGVWLALRSLQMRLEGRIEWCRWMLLGIDKQLEGWQESK